MNPDVLLEQGGFAFCAVAFGGLLVLALRVFREVMRERGSFITRLLDESAQEHRQLLDALQEHQQLIAIMKESIAATRDSLQQIQLALARMNGTGK